MKQDLKYMLYKFSGRTVSSHSVLWSVYKFSAWHPLKHTNQSSGIFLEANHRWELWYFTLSNTSSSEVLHFPQNMSVAEYLLATHRLWVGCGVFDKHRHTRLWQPESLGRAAVMTCQLKCTNVLLLSCSMAGCFHFCLVELIYQQKSLLQYVRSWQTSRFIFEFLLFFVWLKTKLLRLKYILMWLFYYTNKMFFIVFL